MPPRAKKRPGAAAVRAPAVKRTAAAVLLPYSPWRAKRAGKGPVEAHTLRPQVEVAWGGAVC